MERFSADLNWMLASPASTFTYFPFESNHVERLGQALRKMARIKPSTCGQGSAPKQGVERRSNAVQQAEGGCGEASVGKRRRKPGQKRRGLSMGRYPYLTLLARYAKETEGFYSPATVAETHRKLRRLGLDLLRLKNEKKVRTDDPTKMGVLEVTELLKHMRERGLSVNTVSKQMGQLKVFLEWCGNPVIANLQEQNKQAIPMQRVRRLPSLSEDDFHRILSSADAMPGWRGRVAEILMAIYGYSGLRMSELRLAHLEDLDLQNWTIKVRHPKGEASWGEKRVVYIPEPARRYVVCFMTARAEMLYERGLREDVIPLIPSISPRGRMDFYTAQGIGALKRRVERLSGVKFDIRSLRRTYGQLLLDRGATIDAVSKSMGHSSTKTTETYYCRKSDAMVREEIDRAWGSVNPSSKTRKINSGKNDLIEFEKYLSGYA